MTWARCWFIKSAKGPPEEFLEVFIYPFLYPMAAPLENPLPLIPLTLIPLTMSFALFPCLTCPLPIIPIFFGCGFAAL